MLVYLTTKSNGNGFDLTPTLPIDFLNNNQIKVYPSVNTAIIDLSQHLTKEEQGANLEVYVYIVTNKPKVINTETIINDYGITNANFTQEMWLEETATTRFATTIYLNVHNPTTIEGTTLITYPYTEEKPQLKERYLHWLDYYIESLNNKMYLKRKWITSIISIKEKYRPTTEPYLINLDPESSQYYCHDLEGNKINITGVSSEHPPVSLFRKIKLDSKSNVPNITKETITTTGELLNNYCAIVYQFGDVIDYIPGKWSPKTVHSIFKQLKEQSILTADKIIKAQTMVEQLDTYNDYVVPAASRATFTTHPNLKKRKQELLEENKDKLHDQTVLAKISDELIALDKEHIEGDESESFFIKGKMFDVVRKKTLIMQGTEKDLNGEQTDLITTSLDEGWKVEDLPNQVNGLRAGAFMRGNQTALGGVDVKTMQRNLSLYKITERDCGSKKGLHFQVTKFNKSNWVGRYLLGKKEALTEVDLESLVGQWITLRDIGFCKVEPFGVCEVCMGDKVKEKKKAIALETSNIGSASMAAMMSATHGRALKLTKVSLSEVSS